MFNLTLTSSLHTEVSLETQLINCPSVSALETLNATKTLSFTASFGSGFDFETTITRKYNFSELVNLPIFSDVFITDNQALKFLSEMTALSRSDVSKVLTALRNLISLSVQNGVNKIYLLAFDVQIVYKDDQAVILISRY